MAHHLLEYAKEMWIARGSGPMGEPQRLDFVSIDAWQRVRGVQLATWELRILLAMDAEYIREIAVQREERSSSEKTPEAPPGQSVSSRNMSAELFDAFF